MLDMKIFLLSSYFLLCFVKTQSQDITAIINAADRLELVMDENGAFNKFKEIVKIQPTNMYALNKCSELCSRIGKRQSNKKITNDFYDAAKNYASIALKVDPKNSEANCVMAIALGRSSLNKGGKEKIATAIEIKKYVDIAIKNDPQNFKAWHVLGRWNYELSNLNILERTAAKLLYGNIPTGSVQQAILAFEKSNSIATGFILNYLELAKAYNKNDQANKAISTINKMLLLPNHTEDDASIKTEGRLLLKDYE